MTLRRHAICILVVLLAVLVSPAAPKVAESAEIQVGLAQVDITPPIGGRTTGYASAEPTDGVHDPLSARVVLFKSVDTTVALVAWDLCVVNSPWLFEQVKSLGIDHLLLANTHTHAGPRLKEEDFPSSDDPWRRTIEQRVLAALREAQQNLFPALFAAGEGDVVLGYNRLVRQPGGFAVTHFENPELTPYGPVDPTVGVVRIADQEGKIRALIVNYACHPVVLGPRNRRISADFPGVMRRLVEARLGPETMCVFVQGCCGDINPLRMARGEERDGDFDVVEQVGAELAAVVLDTVDQLEAAPGQSQRLAVAAATVDATGRFDPQKTIGLGVTTLLINDEIAVMTMPGEPFQKFQGDFRRMAGVPHAYVFGYCSNGPYDWPSYLPDLESAAYGGYGASDTTVAEVGAGERLINHGLVQLYQLQHRLKPAPVRQTNE